MVDSFYLVLFLSVASLIHVLIFAFAGTVPTTLPDHHIVDHSSDCLSSFLKLYMPI